MRIGHASTAFLVLVLVPAVQAAAQHPSDVGVVHFASSGSRAAQAPFLRGIAELHNFEYREAAEAFQQAERADPKFALPYWFEALTHSPIMWSIDDTAAAHAVLARLGPTPAARLAKVSTPHERAFAAAIEAFYSDTTLTARTNAFADSLSTLAQRDSTDLEASAFAALANLMYDMQPGVHNVEHSTYARRAIAFAERVYHANPRHPGAAHYLIHASDALNAYTPLALQPAFDYAYIAPAAEHAQHMPAHVFLKLGLWHDVVASNERAWKASVAEAAHDHRPPTELDYHDFTWLQYAYLQEGRWRAARAMIDSARKMIAPYDSGSTFNVDAHYVPTFLEFAYANETGRWQDGPRGAPANAPLGSAPVRMRELRQMRATNGERATAALLRGDTSVIAARRVYGDTITQGMEFEALIAERRGDRERALDWWRRAAVGDTTVLRGGPPRWLVARERLAALLLAMGRPAEAASEYERSLTEAPGRSSALLGLARARLAMGDTTGSAVAYAHLLDNWRHADADLPDLAEARRGATRAKPTTIANTDSAITKQRVWFKNGALVLEGFLFKPAGKGPFPVVVWNHGSEKNPAAGKQFDGVADVFVPHGYVVFAPDRRGHDESEGEHIAVLRGREAGPRGPAAGDALVARLLPTEQLSDQLAGVSYMKRLPFVDTTRMVVAGCSFGGIMSFMAAEGDHGFKASLTMSPAAQNWNHNAPLRAEMIAGVAKIHIPVLLMQPPRDASLGPARDLGAEFTRLKKDYRGKVWPDTLSGRDATHCFGGSSGDRIWAGDAVAFFDSVLHRTPTAAAQPNAHLHPNNDGDGGAPPLSLRAASTPQRPAGSRRASASRRGRDAEP